MVVDSFPKIPIQEMNPFCSLEFHHALESSASLGKRTGWYPQHLQIKNSILPGYIKTNSYGEYIFDWAWAEFYHKNGVEYYPKLIHAIPFTPVNAPKFLNSHLEQIKELAQESFNQYLKSHLSGEHYLFISDEETHVLEALDFKILHTIQYHFKNHYHDFGHFLDHLTKNRRKMIKKERRKIQESDLQIERLTGEEITPVLLKNFYSFYLQTIDKKQSFDYLNESFFELLSQQLPHKLMVTQARKGNEIIAMALFYYSEETLYGRNWGIASQYESEYKNLHFELCYYQGIDFCIEKKIKLFEAGAQGEHKLWRGFEPVIIKSAHHMRNEVLAKPIYQDINYQNVRTEAELHHLKSFLPFKK